MRNLPPAIIQVLRHFEPMFSERVWEWAKILLVGAILASGKRTVTSALCVMGLSHERQFQNFDRVLNRATWSSRAVSCVLCAGWYRPSYQEIPLWSLASTTISNGGAGRR